MIKIYFEDDYLVPFDQIPKCDFVLNAGAGIHRNEAELDMIYLSHPICSLYTNSFVALSSEYCWNYELQVPELYLRAGPNREFTRVDHLTDKELRVCHNLLSLYRKGAFNTDTIRNEGRPDNE